MPEMNLNNVDQICRDIKRLDISYSHLKDELIDHICCDVESEMNQGLNFNDAYNKVKLKIGPRRLNEIQEETLYAIDSKYRLMKTLMKISAVAGTAILGFAAILKIQHIAGGGILLLAGAIVLAFLFLPSALTVLWKETHNNKRILTFISIFFTGFFFILSTLLKLQHWPGADLLLLLAAISGIFFFLPALVITRFMDKENKTGRPLYLTGVLSVVAYAAGIFFKTQHWPLATILISSGAILFTVVFLPWYTYTKWKEETHVSSTFLFILIGAVLIVVPGTMINLNLQNSYDYGYFSNAEQQQELFKYSYKNNITFINRYRDSVQYSKLEQLHSKTRELIVSIAGIQANMSASPEGRPGKPNINREQITDTDNGPMIQYNKLSRPFIKDPVRNFLLPASAERIELVKSMKSYADYLSELNPGRDIQKYRELLNLQIYFPEASGNAEYSMITGLFSLELLKNSIMAVESSMISEIIKR